MRAFMADLAKGAFTYAPPTIDHLRRAMEIDTRFANLGLGLVDASIVVLAEELGFMGATAVVVLFALLVWRAVDIGQRALVRGLPFHGLLAIGIGLMLGLQATISIGVNTGLLPTKGLALPLISYGRTSAVVTLLALGLLLRIAHEIAKAPATESERRAQ